MVRVVINTHGEQEPFNEIGNASGSRTVNVICYFRI